MFSPLSTTTLNFSTIIELLSAVALHLDKTKVWSLDKELYIIVQSKQH